MQRHPLSVYLLFIGVLVLGRVVGRGSHFSQVRHSLKPNQVLNVKYYVCWSWLEYEWNGELSQCAQSIPSHPLLGYKQILQYLSLKVNRKSFCATLCLRV